MPATATPLNQKITLSFLLAIVLAGAWVALSYWFPNFAPTGIPNSFALILLGNCVILFGLWRGLARTDFTPAARITVWLVIAAAVTVWIAVILNLAVQETFRPRGGWRVIPALPLAIMLPVPIGLVLLTRWKRIPAILDATPASWLIGLQVYRVLGAIFLVEWARNNLPGAFALPAGIGDVAVGLLALPAALWVSSGRPNANKVGIWWNVLGLADFAVAVTMGMFTSPGIAHLVAIDHPSEQLGLFPLVMIPAFAVPNSILLHVLSIWQLRRRQRNAATAV